ncbi:MAG TPA: transcriptional regulator [Candidatus Krumholzibacteria bacterium]|nr:transcriptional regulator [Candidatus Krumholzibacteria bacterium]
MHSRQSTQDIFIEGWGRLGPAWGISRVMAEIYALLYVSEQPLTLEEMSRTLKTSRSNVSTNVRQLLDLSVVHRVIVRGERKDYYTAEEDITKVAKLLALAKKRKELDPAMDIVETTLASAAGSGDEATVRRMEELKRHMEFVNAIFQAFAGGESDPKSLANVIRVKDTLS